MPSTILTALTTYSGAFIEAGNCAPPEPRARHRHQANTGPIDVTAWDPARGGFARMHTSDTEAIYSYRAIGDALYAPATDRRDHADYAVGEPWRDENPVTVAPLSTVMLPVPNVHVLMLDEPFSI